MKAGCECHLSTRDHLMVSVRPASLSLLHISFMLLPDVVHDHWGNWENCGKGRRWAVQIERMFLVCEMWTGNGRIDA